MSNLLRMKKWSGGTLLVALTVIFVLRYSVMETQPKKQSSYDFFKGQSKSGSNLEGKDIYQVQSPEKHKRSIKKPRLINVAGVDDLYSNLSVSEDVPNARLVWAHMQDLISRSDSLPEAAQGVKEASIAWKDLVATLEKSRIVNISNNGNGTEDQNCPYFLNALNLTLLRNETLLEFPCGLVQDSSVSVVAIPSGDHGCFQIELMGPQFTGQPIPSVILNYRVNLQGKEGPLIVQNTWTAEHGWGEEERCPAYGSSGNLKVDGLLRCNEQVGGTALLEENHNLNQTHLNSEKAGNASKGSAHVSANFPFVDGHPFAATVWVGQEGFHMTVNGRHETSYSFRNHLEPWMISGIRVTGDLELFSIIANNLPVSEFPELVVDVEQLKAPPVSKKRISMLVGVFSTGNNFERRMALRRSWMQYEAVRSGDVAVRFFIGFHKNKQVNLELWKEADRYGDIQLMPFVDYYSLITLKTIAICIFGTKILPAKYIMKTDDDAFVRVDEVLSNLREKKVSNGLLYGLMSFDSEPIRDRDSKWYISEEEWPQAKYPPWAHGPGYIVSRDIAKFIVQGHKERDLKLFKLEDVATGIWIEQYRNSGRDVNYISDDRFNNAGCEKNYILAHYQGPRLMLCLWEKLQKEHEPNCCE